MKKINYLLLCFVLSVVVFSGCKSDDGGSTPPNPEQDALNMLQGTWDVTAATRDQTSILDDYSDLSVTISNKTITEDGAPSTSIFPTGSFTFKEGSDYKVIIVNDSGQGPVEVNLTGSSATQLSTSFSLDEDGRDNSAKILLLDGAYVFKFGK